MHDANDLRAALRHNLRAVDSRVLDQFYSHLEDSYRTWSGVETDAPPWAAAVEIYYRLKEFLDGYIEELSSDLAILRRHYSEYSQRYTHAVSQQDREEQIIEFARALGATRPQLIGDRRAFSRWFAHDAVVDRYQRRHADLERRIALSLERLGAIAAVVLETVAPEQGARATWHRLALERVIKPLLSHDGDPRVRIAAFRSLADALRALPEGQQQGYVSKSTFQYIYRSSLDVRQPVWIQCEALVLLRDLSPEILKTALQKRLGVEIISNDDLFVRRRAIQVLAGSLHALPQLAAVLPLALREPSAYARQGLAEMLPAIPFTIALKLVSALALQDDSPQVRAAAINALPLLADHDVTFEHALGCLRRVFETERDRFVVRVALRTATIGHARLSGREQEQQAQNWLEQLAPAIEALHNSADDIRMRRWAAHAREHLWVQADAVRRELYAQLSLRLNGAAPEKAQFIRRRDLATTDPETLGRVLSVITQNEHGWGIEPGRSRYRFQGETRRFRLWRFLYEIRNPSTDKRQAFRHTIGRVFRGTIRAPSNIMAELSETKVPGEPLFIPSDDSWRPYIPLVDEFISALDHGGKPLRLYTAEGVTEIEPPRAPHRWLRARTALSTRFAYYAGLRNWQEDSQIKADSYIREVRKLGFTVRFLPHEYETDIGPQNDASVARFFAATPIFGVSISWEPIRDYFFSIYENTLYDLGLFALGLTTLFVGRHLYLNRRFRRARERIPLVVGGWGTRGKSGTERLKAALFNAMGYSIVSKTTGCEAMFLMAHPFDSVREMFLFRPYDKATIWEQTNIVEMAARLHGEIFLWECMGLQPVYVGILQRQWMHDDIATITNTYPDHEDVQGPAGIDVAEVMTNFIPRNSRLLTSEEQMLPVLRTAATQLGTKMRSVGWFEAGMLTPDVMDRFPYEEHPFNVALVLTMADELGVERDFAIKEIADRVVPDLGVLKTYPTAEVRGRKLEYIMGMSANERLGCLTNWARMNMDTQDPYESPGVWVSTVVNNRADRVPRSRVFADIIAADVSVDRHVLIGTNIKGLYGYIHEAWQSHAASLTLWPEQQDGESDAATVFETAARRMRVPLSDAHISERLQAMLTGLGVAADRVAAFGGNDGDDALRQGLSKLQLDTYADDIIVAISAARTAYQEYQAFVRRLGAASNTDRARIDQEYRDLMWRWLEAKLVVVDDPHTPGEQIIDRICRETPPGIRNRIMGMQNIKGTGLDFVYRWEAWLACHTACQQLRDADTAVANEGLRFLVGFREFGMLSEPFVRQTIAHVEQHGTAHGERFRSELAMVLSNLDQAMNELRGKSSGSGSAGSTRGARFMAYIANSLEAALDVGDAIKRRKIAKQIYADLANERIGQQRAVLELQKLNKRQKGGWVAQRISDFFARLRRDPTSSPAEAKG
ncbi:MAG: hypothetical protein OEQ39_06905 [Gammaproteobacteria bacterium]|nr:hypothetical protein [Gammaproteobacteria bacterium]MDH3465049.1 hypothetical protein [Gammaproteobacteria bacterium]